MIGAGGAQHGHAEHRGGGHVRDTASKRLNRYRPDLENLRIFESTHSYTIYEAVIFSPASINSGFHILPSVEAQITGSTGTAVLDESRGGLGGPLP